MKEIKYCPSCGESVMPRQAECATCGAKIPANPNNLMEVLAEKKWAVGVVAAIVMVAVFVVGLGNVVKDADKADEEPATELAEQVEGQAAVAVETAKTDRQSAETVSEAEAQPSSAEHPYDVACQRKLTYSDIQGMTRSEKRIMRNWIYARHGYIFKSADLKEFFGNQPWYQARYTDVSSMLSDVEQYNINFIKQHE